MANQRLKGNKEQRKVVLATLRTRFLFHIPFWSSIQSDAEGGSCRAKAAPPAWEPGIWGGGLCLFMQQTGENIKLRNIPISKRPSMQQEWALLIMPNHGQIGILTKLEGKWFSVACMAHRHSGIHFCDRPRGDEEMDSRSLTIWNASFATVFESGCYLPWSCLRHTVYSSAWRPFPNLIQTLL